MQTPSCYAAAAPMRPSVTPVGELLREWRAARRLSQLELALSAEVSTRHLSCVETGKARASREMIERLAQALEMPLRERNTLMLAAGFAPIYPESSLGVPQLERMRRAIDFILAQQEPYPAFVIDRRWNVMLANAAAARVNAFLLGRPSAHDNIVRQFFDPADLRAHVLNWEEVAGELIRHLHDAVTAVPTDAQARALLDEALAAPGVPRHWRTRAPGTAPQPLLTTEFRRDDRTLRFFSTITTFGTPRDVTLDELHIECCFPCDEDTAAICRALVSSAPAE